jgi:hypothetical protein
MTNKYSDFKMILKKPWLYYSYFLIKSPLRRKISSQYYIKNKYWYKTGKRLNLKTPKSFNEKIQWLKLNYHDSRLPKLVDKIAVRDFVAAIIGPEYLIPLIALYDSPSAIDFSSLPNSFVLKTNHDSGGVVICSEKMKFNKNTAMKTLQNSFDTNFYYSGREWPYKALKPRIICEEYLTDESGHELKDYKIFCFHGKAKIIQVDFNRFTNHTRNLYDPDWNFLPYEIEFKSDPTTIIPKPKVLDTMINLAEKLACDFPHVRVDLYTFHEKIYFGELTFYHGSGWEKFHPESFDLLLGSYLNLPNNQNEKRINPF